MALTSRNLTAMIRKLLKCDCRAIEEVGHGQVAQAVVVEVGCGNPHAGDGLPLAVAGHARLLADFFELKVASVGEEPARRSVIGDVDVGSVVTRQLRDQYAQSAAFAQVDSGRDRDVGKCPVSVIAVEPIGLRGEVFGAAVIAPAVRGRAKRSRFRVVIEIIRDVEVEIAVAVEIGKCRRRAPEA